MDAMGEDDEGLEDLDFGGLDDLEEDIPLDDDGKGDDDDLEVGAIGRKLRGDDLESLLATFGAGQNQVQEEEEEEEEDGLGEDGDAARWREESNRGAGSSDSGDVRRLMDAILPVGVPGRVEESIKELTEGIQIIPVRTLRVVKLV